MRVSEIIKEKDESIRHWEHRATLIEEVKRFMMAHKGDRMNNKLLLELSESNIVAHYEKGTVRIDGHSINLKGCMSGEYINLTDALDRDITQAEQKIKQLSLEHELWIEHAPRVKAIVESIRDLSDALKYVDRWKLRELFESALKLDGERD